MADLTTAEIVDDETIDIYKINLIPLQLAYQHAIENSLDIDGGYVVILADLNAFFTRMIMKQVWLQKSPEDVDRELDSYAAYLISENKLPITIILLRRRWLIDFIDSIFESQVIANTDDQGISLSMCLRVGPPADHFHTIVAIDVSGGLVIQVNNTPV